MSTTTTIKPAPAPTKAAPAPTKPAPAPKPPVPKKKAVVDPIGEQARYDAVLPRFRRELLAWLESRLLDENDSLCNVIAESLPPAEDSNARGTYTEMVDTEYELTFALGGPGRPLPACLRLKVDYSKW
jgi:hypothetical protein